MKLSPINWNYSTKQIWNYFIEQTFLVVQPNQQNLSAARYICMIYKLSIYIKIRVYWVILHSPGVHRAGFGEPQDGIEPHKTAEGEEDSRLGVSGLVALEGVGQVVFVVHVALGAQVVVKAHFAFPPHASDAVLLAAVTDDVGVTDTWGRKREWEIHMNSREKSGF